MPDYSDPELCRVIFRFTDATVISGAAEMRATLARLFPTPGVWVVYRDVFYQGAELLGVYATAEVAMAAHAPPDPMPIWCTAWKQARAASAEGGELLDWWTRDDGGDTVNAERYQVHSAPPVPGGDSE